MSGSTARSASPKPAIVVVGCSLGGASALRVLLAALPRDYPLPLAIVQHRGLDSVDLLAPALQEVTQLEVREAEDKEPILAGHAYLAPADYHLLVEEGRFALSTDAKVLSARPSIDVLFESAADAYRERVLGVLLTGASRDGTNGALRIKRKGGMVVVQDPASAESGIMPRSAIDSCAVDRVMPLDGIASFLKVQGWSRDD